MAALSNNLWSGEAWGSEDATKLGLELPWNGNDKVKSQWAAAFDPDMVFLEQDTGIPDVQMALRGGTWSESAGSSVTMTLADPNHPTDRLTLSGVLAADSGAGTVSGWIRIPNTYFPQIGTSLLPSSADGRYVVPTVSCSSTAGACRAVAIALRSHGTQPRWPAGWSPNPEFAEVPEAYLVYFEVMGAPRLEEVPCTNAGGLLAASGLLVLVSGLWAMRRDLPAAWIINVKESAEGVPAATSQHQTYR